MSAEQLKVLEMVAEGKITPEEGVRLLRALGEGRGGRSLGFDLPEVKIPKIDLGHLGDMCVELKNSVVEGAKKAQGQLKRSRFGRFTELKDFPLSIDRPEGAALLRMRFDVRAGKLKLVGEELAGKLLEGKLKRALEEPLVMLEKRDNEVELRIRQNLGRGLYRISPAMPIKLAVDNAAAEAEYKLAELEVDELSIDNNAGSVMVELGERAAQVKVGIQNNAGSIQLIVPQVFAVKVVPTGSLSSHNLERCGLEIVNGAAVSGDYETNERRVEIVLNQNVSSFKLDWRRGDGVTVEEEKHDPAEDEMRSSSGDE